MPLIIDDEPQHDDAPSDINEELRRLDAVRRLSELKKDFGLMFYQPFPKQDMFHKHGHIKRRYVRTGNRFGKSTLGAAEDCAWAFGKRPWYPDSDPACWAGIPKRSTKGLIIVADWDKAHEIFTNPADGQAKGKLLKFLPSEAITRLRRNASGAIYEITVKCIHGGESTITLDTIKSFKSNPMGQESSDWDWIHVDEPCPKDMWIANARGLVDRNGSAWFTCTPINQAWINDMFLIRKFIRKEIDGSVQKDENHWMVTGSSYDNPHNTAEALAMFENELSDAEKECRIKGMPLALSGLVYKSFDEAVHVLNVPPIGWKDWLHPPKGYTIRVFVDPHPSTPHAVLFAATSPQGFVFYFHEIFRQCLIHDLCDMINEVCEGHEIANVYLDPAGFINNPITGECFADIFYNEGLIPEKAVKDLTGGIMATQAALGKRLRLPDGKLVPVLYFAPHLSETLWEFDHYEWMSDRHDKPVDKDDHMMENLYRSIMHKVDTYVAPDESNAVYVPLSTNFKPVY